MDSTYTLSRKSPMFMSSVLSSGSPSAILKNGDGGYFVFLMHVRMRKKVKSYNARLSFFPLTIFTVFLIYSSLSAATAKSLQSCPTLCNPRDGSPPGSPVPGILQARTLEWVATSFSNAWKWNVKVKSLSRVWLLATPWTAAYLAPLSMGFSRQEYWSGVPSPSPSSLSSHKQLWKCLLFPPLPLKFIFSFPLPLTVSFPFFSSLHLFAPLLSFHFFFLTCSLTKSHNLFLDICRKVSPAHCLSFSKLNL